jgi:hypothetical protein
MLVSSNPSIKYGINDKIPRLKPHACQKLVKITGILAAGPPRLSSELFS